LSKKIRNASKQKIPNVLIIGEQELENGTVTLRRFGVQEQQTLLVAAFIDRLESAIRIRLRDPI